MENKTLVLQEMLRVAKNKVLITCDVGVGGMSTEEFDSCFTQFGISFPGNLPTNLLKSSSIKLVKYGQRPIWKYRHIRVACIELERTTRSHQF